MNPKEAKHTPGEWKVSDSGEDLISIRNVGTGFRIARVNSLTGDSEIGQANARLIAAAPDLLAACEKALRSIIENTSPSMRPAWACATTEMLHAVLVKAGVRDCPMCEYAEGTCGECRAAIQKAEGQGR